MSSLSPLLYFFGCVCLIPGTIFLLPYFIHWSYAYIIAIGSLNTGEIVLRLQDVHYDGIRFGKELNRIELDAKEKVKYRLDKGDLLFIRVNGNPEYVGRSAVFQGFSEDVFHNDHIIRIKFKDSFNSQFLSYMLNLPGGKKIISSK